MFSETRTNAGQLGTTCTRSGSMTSEPSTNSVQRGTTFAHTGTPQDHTRHMFADRRVVYCTPTQHAPVPFTAGLARPIRERNYTILLVGPHQEGVAATLPDSLFGSGRSGPCSWFVSGGTPVHPLAVAMLLAIAHQSGLALHVQLVEQMDPVRIHGAHLRLQPSGHHFPGGFNG